MFKPEYLKSNDTNIKTRNAMLMPLREKIRVVIGSEEEIFGEKFLHAYNPMNRLIKIKKDAISYE